MYTGHKDKSLKQVKSKKFKNKTLLSILKVVVLIEIEIIEM